MNTDFSRLPGSLQWCPIGGDGSLETFLTNAAVAELKQYGLEIIGANFNVTKVELTTGKNNVTENTVWTGYFWMNEWTTLELAKTSFNGIDWSDYKAIRFYSEANRTNYVINVMTGWESGDKLGDQSTMTMTNDYAELSLDGINMANKLASPDKLMIQCNKEGGAAFNFTAIELVPVNTAIETTTVEKAEKVQKSLQNGRVVITKGGVKYNAVGQEL